MSKEFLNGLGVLTQELFDSLLEKPGPLIEKREDQFVEGSNYEAKEQKNKAQADSEIKDKKRMDSPLGNWDGFRLRRLGWELRDPH